MARDLSTAHDHAPQSGEGPVAAAIAAAESAGEIWATASCTERASALRGVARLLRLHAARLAGEIATATGTPIGATRSGLVRHAAPAFTRAALESESHGVLTTPPRVAALIAPQCSPLTAPLTAIADHLAAGDAVLWQAPKAAARSCVSVLELLRRAGLPSGLIGLIPADNVSARVLASNDRVGAVRGSRVLRQQVVRPGDDFDAAIETVVRQCLAGGTHGGQAPRVLVHEDLHQGFAEELEARVGRMGVVVPFDAEADADLQTFNTDATCVQVVLADADIEAAAAMAARDCLAPDGTPVAPVSRILVATEVHDSFVSALDARAAVLRSGDPHDPLTEVGPISSPIALAIASTLLDDAWTRGANVRSQSVPRGRMLPPAILTEVTADMHIAGAGPIGPFALITRVVSLEDAMRDLDPTSAISLWGAEEGTLSGREIGARAASRNAPMGYWAAAGQFVPGLSNSPDRQRQSRRLPVGVAPSSRAEPAPR